MQITLNTQLADSISKYHLKIYDCGYADVGTDWHSNVVNPQFSRLYFILDGCAWFEASENREYLKEGCCYLLPSHFSFRCGCESRMRQLYFHLALLDENRQDVFPFLTAPLSFPFDSETKAALTEGISTHSPSVSFAMEIHSRLLGIISRLLQDCQFTIPEKTYSPCVSYALQYIHQHISAQLTVTEIAAYSFASQSTLSKCFRRELGVTVGRYVENLVFTQAQFLLRNPGLSIAEISEKLGFCDQFYFSRRFKRLFKESPQSYRNSVVI